MGPIVQIVAWLIFYFIIGCILSLFFLVIFLFLQRKEKSKKTLIKKYWVRFIIIIFCFSTILSVVSTGFVVHDIESVNDDYWKNDGGWEFYRMPLEYPYELYLNSAFTYGSLEEWKGHTIYTDGITAFFIHEHTMFGTLHDNRYFIFPFKKGRIEIISSKVSYKLRLKDYGINDAHRFEPVRKHFSRFMKSK